ncbi:MAG TPA: 2-polyprenyl-3-methyl-6-methoxy-1,4-benzoquinone monooxygenase [Gammaproteobacteria bacterium]|nr:2-polyprenyl-3-methyl-6-methoxy-1,4-benzoquinone monooxygenase [Gammaproteobacteria bacterium]
MTSLICNMRNNTQSISDKIFGEFDRFLKIVAHKPAAPHTPTPKSEAIDVELSDYDKRNIQGLMRINHTGEVCAQALYYGQAMFAKDGSTHAHLIQAAAEEHDHLYWCQERLDDLGARVSILNPFWYISSFALGATAAFFGDRVSYGFVIEVENQVEDHLQEHIEQIPQEDIKTHAILKQMQLDEIRHANDARDAGGLDLPIPVKKIMTAMSKFMKFLVYRI